MQDRKSLKFPSILFQFWDSFFESEFDRASFEKMLDILQVTEQELRNPEYQFNGEQLFLMLKMLHRVPFREPPALIVLRYLSINNMGMAGIAGLTALKLEDALNITMLYYKVIMPAAHFELTEHDGTFNLIVDWIADFEEYNYLLTEMTLGALKQFADVVTGENLHLSLSFDHAPRWGDTTEEATRLYKKYFDCDVQFNADYSGITASVDTLSIRTKNPNNVLYSYARNIIEKEINLIQPANSFSDKIKKLLLEDLQNERASSLEGVAAKLHMTPRTLSRKLAKESTQYKTLLNEVRFNHAKMLLKQTDMPVKQIAAKLCFSTTDAFSRAFKAYTGKTPNQWKAEHH